MRRINKWTFLIHFSDPGTGVLGPILVHFAAFYGTAGPGSLFPEAGD